MYWKKAVTADCARGVSSQGLPPTEHARNTQTHTHTLTLTLTRALSLTHTTLSRVHATPYPTGA